MGGTTSHTHTHTHTHTYILATLLHGLCYLDVIWNVGGQLQLHLYAYEILL